MTGLDTHAALQQLARPLQRGALAAGGVGAVGTALVALGGVAWLARLGIVQTPWWVIGAWVLAVGAGALVVRDARREVVRVAPDALAHDLEARGTFRQGSLRLLLDEAASGVSDQLLAAADRAQAVALASLGAAAVEGDRQRLRGRLRRTLSVALVGGTLVGTARPVGGTASALWRPDLAWAALMAPLEIQPDRQIVERGETVQLSLRASGRRQAVLWTRAPGEGWEGRTIQLDSVGRGREIVGPLRGELHARLTAGGRSSDTVTVSVRLPVFLGSLVVTARYPEYLGVEAEPIPLGPEPVLLPEGTRLTTDGRATSALALASWASGDLRHDLAVDGEHFSGEFRPTGDRDWMLTLRTAEGTQVATAGSALLIRMVPDLPPVVEVPVPGTDTVVTVGPAVALLVDAQDDHGLRQLTLEARGGTAAPRVTRLELPDAMPDRALLGVTIELADYRLQPGDTLWYRFVAMDNAPVAQRGTSRELVLIVPTRSEQRDERREATAEAGAELGALAEQARALERATEDLARRQARGEESQRPGDNPMGLEEARRAEEVARSQEDLMQRMEALEQSLAELERAAAEAGIADSVFDRRMAEIREELAKALSPELREQLAELEAALRNLDAPKTREALGELSEAQRQMREALERSQELFERAALEGELSAISQEAREMAAAQEQWAERMAGADTGKAAMEERALSQRADSLAADIARTAGQMQSEAGRQEMQQASEAAQAAAEQMRQAAQAASEGRRQEAAQRGEQAARQMGEVQEQVDQSRGEQQDEWREEVLQALDQALLETTRLTQKQLRVAQGFRGGQQAASLRAEQAAIEEGARQLIEQVIGAGGKNALVPPQIAGALAAAREQMGLARETIASASLNLREGAERAGEAVDALNVAAFLLLRARGNVSNSSSGSGMAEAMEQMAQMAQQQGGIGQEAASLLPMMGDAGTEQRLQELAGRQRQLARDLERLRAETNAGAAERFAEDALELARELESGRLDAESIARQERLFRRMLDAGRTLQGEEEDERKERESESAVDPAIRLPPALQRRLLDADGRVRLPSWEELQRYSPEERRLVADYFRRLTGGRP